MPFSEFIAYGDESGTATFGKIEADFPAVGLAFCVFRVEDYVREVVPQVQALKFRYFGHDQVVLHESDVRRGQGQFKFGSPVEWNAFMGDLDALIKGLPMTVVATVVDQRELRHRHAKSLDAYDLALRCCVEQLIEKIEAEDQTGPRPEIHVVAEARSAERDRVALDRFRDGLPNAGPLATPPSAWVNLRFAHKQANSSGLQIADLVARPIVLQVLRPDQPNRAWDAIAPKMHASGGGWLAGTADLDGIAFVPEREGAPGGAGAHIWTPAVGDITA